MKKGDPARDWYSRPGRFESDAGYAPVAQSDRAPDWKSGNPW